MTKHEEAAKMRADGKSIDEIMLRFGWDRQRTYEMISRGRRPHQFREAQLAYYYQNRDRIREHYRSQARLVHDDYKPRPASRLENRDYVRERNRRVVAMVKAGATYAEAATAQCITREAVAGICHRAGVKAPVTPQKIERINNRKSEAAVKRWNKSDTQSPPRI